VRPDDTLRQLKDQVFRNRGFPPCTQNYRFCGEPLNEDHENKTLEEIGICGWTGTKMLYLDVWAPSVGGSKSP
jgi:hypothetical protein